MSFARVTPILRIFDEAKAREFYVGFLEFNIDWEHRFSEGAPLYMQVSKDGCVLHLSEHYGDCCPGAAMRIQTDELELYLTRRSSPLPWVARLTKCNALCSRLIASRWTERT